MRVSRKVADAVNRGEFNKSLGIGRKDEAMEQEIVKTVIDVHVFHYVTHSVVWEVFFTDVRQPDMSHELPSATEGRGLQVWCNFYLTREAAEKAAERTADDTLDRFFDVNTVWHTN